MSIEDSYPHFHSIKYFVDVGSCFRLMRQFVVLFSEIERLQGRNHRIGKRHGVLRSLRQVTFATSKALILQ